MATDGASLPPGIASGATAPSSTSPSPFLLNLAAPRTAALHNTNQKLLLLLEQPGLAAEVRAELVPSGFTLADMYSIVATLAKARLRHAVHNNYSAVSTRSRRRGRETAHLNWGSYAHTKMLTSSTIGWGCMPIPDDMSNVAKSARCTVDHLPKLQSQGISRLISQAMLG